jgi:hypothetical protein
MEPEFLTIMRRHNRICPMADLFLITPPQPRAYSSRCLFNGYGSGAASRLGIPIMLQIKATPVC